MCAKTNHKIDQTSQRIAKIRTHFCGSDNRIFAGKLGKDTTYTSQICSGSKAVGQKVLDQILEAFPEVSRAWLILGEGPMIAGACLEDDQRRDPVNNINNSGDYCNNSIEPSHRDEVIELYRRMIDDKDRTIDDLRRRVEEQNKWIHLVTERYINVLDSIKSTTEDTNDIVRLYREKIGYKIGDDAVRD